MKILYLSDLHLEFWGDHCQPASAFAPSAGDVVVLAGDIAPGLAGLNWARRQFSDVPIVYVAGNHEFYGHEYHRNLESLRRRALKLGIHFLENDSVTIAGVRFLGATLWTDFDLLPGFGVGAAMDRARKGMVDFRAIYLSRPQEEARALGRRLAPEDTLVWHAASRAWLEAQLPLATDESVSRKTVVVTHHFAHPLACEPRLRRDPLSPAYGSDLKSLMGRCALWIHGHTHYGVDFEVASPDGAGIATRVLSNPRGYPDEKSAPGQQRFSWTRVVGLSAGD